MGEILSIPVRYSMNVPRLMGMSRSWCWEGKEGGEEVRGRKGMNGGKKEGKREGNRVLVNLESSRLQETVGMQFIHESSTIRQIILTI